MLCSSYLIMTWVGNANCDYRLLRLVLSRTAERLLSGAIDGKSSRTVLIY